MDIYIDMKYIMFLNFDSINILLCFTVNSSFSPFPFPALNLFSFPSVAMQNCLKDIQAINVHVGLNWAKQAAWCADRLFSSNISTKSPLWHRVGNPGVFEHVPHAVSCKMPLFTTAGPNCISLTVQLPHNFWVDDTQLRTHLFHGKVFQLFPWKKLPLGPSIPTSLLICQKNFLKNLFSWSARWEHCLFSLFSFQKLISNTCQQSETRQNNGLYMGTAVAYKWHLCWSEQMTWQAEMFRYDYKQTIKIITAIWEPARDYLNINHFEQKHKGNISEMLAGSHLKKGLFFFFLGGPYGKALHFWLTSFFPLKITILSFNTVFFSAH